MVLLIDGKLEVDAHVRRTQYVHRSCPFNIVSWHLKIEKASWANSTLVFRLTVIMKVLLVPCHKAFDIINRI